MFQNDNQSSPPKKENTQKQRKAILIKTIATNLLFKLSKFPGISYKSSYESASNINSNWSLIIFRSICNIQEKLFIQ